MGRRRRILQERGLETEWGTGGCGPHPILRPGRAVRRRERQIAPHRRSKPFPLVKSFLRKLGLASRDERKVPNKEPRQ